MATDGLESLLQKMDAGLEAHHPAAWDTLQAPAHETELEALGATCLEDRALPAQLAILYRWHNGQTGFRSLSEEDNRIFLPISRTIAAWQFLRNEPDLKDRPPRSRLPVFANGAGDYLMLETEGENEGKLIGWFHDDDRRPTEYASIQDWTENLLEAIYS